MITLNVPGIPVAQPRVKATIRGKHAAVYTPTKNGIAVFKAGLKLAASQARTGGLITGPIRVDCVFVFPRQANRIWAKKPMPRYRKTSKPDIDNLQKAVLDALNGVLWTDDAQVCAGGVEKWHAAGDESPHTVVWIEAIEPEGKQ